MADGLFQGASIYKTPAEIMQERRAKYQSRLSNLSGAGQAGAGIGALFAGFLPNAELEKAESIDKVFEETQQEFAGRPEEEKSGKPWSEMSQFEQQRALLSDTSDLYFTFSEKLANMGYASEAEAARAQAIEAMRGLTDLAKAEADVDYTRAGAESRRAKDPFKDLPQMTSESRRQINALMDADDELQALYGEGGTMVGRGLQTLGALVGMAEPPAEGVLSKQQLAQSIFALSQRENISLADAAERIKGLSGTVATPSATPTEEAGQQPAPQQNTVSADESVVTQEMLDQFPNLKALGAQPGMIINRQTGQVRNP